MSLDALSKKNHLMNETPALNEPSQNPTHPPKSYSQILKKSSLTSKEFFFFGGGVNHALLLCIIDEARFRDIKNLIMYILAVFLPLSF